jgi:hypothetical protein
VRGEAKWLTLSYTLQRLPKTLSHQGGSRGCGSVATAIADVFWKNAISMGSKFTKMLRIFDKIDEI